MKISVICCFWVNCHLGFMDFCHVLTCVTSQEEVKQQEMSEQPSARDLSRVVW